MMFYTSKLLLIYLFMAWKAAMPAVSEDRKWDPCLCSQELSASIRGVEAVAGTFFI